MNAERLLSRWEARREVQNIMGKLSQSYLMMQEADIYDRWWSKREDVCLGINQGWYQGRNAVSGYYQALGDRIKLSSKLLTNTFPEKLSSKSSEELYGVGQIGIMPIDTFVIEVAGDGKTAKGLWSLHGTHVEVTASGPVSYWDWGYYCVDFILEDDSWKIWHMQELLDICNPTGGDWTKPDLTFDADPRFAEMADFHFPAPNVPAVLRQAYATDRAFTEAPPLPQPYETFAETFSYGL